MISKLRQTIHNPGVASLVVFASMLLVAIGAWGLDHTGHGHDVWGEMLHPEHVFSLIGVLGSVLGSWLSKSPLSVKSLGEA